MPEPWWLKAYGGMKKATDVVTGLGVGAGRGLLHMGEEIISDPLGTYGDYVKGLGVGAAESATRLAGLIPGVNTEGAQERLASIPQGTTTGNVGRAVTSLLPEFTPIGDAAAPLYVKQAIEEEQGAGMVALEALGLLPFVPSAGRIGRRIAGPALLDEAGQIIHDAPKAATHAEVYDEAVKGGLLSGDAWVPEPNKGFIDEKGHWLSREEAMEVAEEGGQFTGAPLSPEEADFLERHEIPRGLLSEETGDFAPLQVGDAAPAQVDVVDEDALTALRSGQDKAVQSFRDFNEATAHQAAREGLHLRKVRDPETNRISGFHGGPPTVKSPQKLTAWRNKFQNMVEQGARHGRFWYDEARRGTGEMTRLLDDEGTTKVALGEGVFSQGADPNVQHGFFTKGWNQHARGEEIVSGRYPTDQSERFRQVLEEGRTDIGPKTGPYGVTMNPTKEMPWIPVTDMWVMRGLDYATESPTDAQRAFIDGEMLRMVQSMNAKLPEGAQQFTVPEVQASMWTYLKGADLAKKYPNRYPDLEAGMEEAAKSHAHFLDNLVMNMTREQTPGAAGHLEGVVKDEGIKQFLRSNDPFMVGHEPTRQDVLTAEAGLLQRDAIPYQGEWEGQFNPGTNVRVLGDKPKGGGGLLSDEFIQQTEGTEMLRGLMQGQQAVAGHRVASGVPTAEQLGVHVPMGRAATPDEMTALSAAAKPEGLFAVDTGRGVNLINDTFSDINRSPQEILSSLKRSDEPDLFGGSLGDKIHQATGTEGVRRGHQTFYQDVFEGTEPGQGVATWRVLEKIDKTPGLARRLDASENLKIVAEQQADLNEAISEMGFGDAREDIQTMLRTIQKGGLPGLRDAWSGGVALPAIGLLGLGVAGQERRKRREGGLLGG